MMLMIFITSLRFPTNRLFNLVGNGSLCCVGSSANRTDIFQHDGDMSVNVQLILKKFVDKGSKKN